MDIETRREDRYAVVLPKGRIDAVTAGEFEAAVKDLIGDGGCPCLIMNLGGIDFISSAGLRAILAIAKALKAVGGSLAFAALQEAVLSVFRISGFDSMFSIYPDEAAAVRGALNG